MIGDIIYALFDIERSYEYRHKVTNMNIKHPYISNSKPTSDLLIYSDEQRLFNNKSFSEHDNIDDHICVPEYMFRKHENNNPTIIPSPGTIIPLLGNTITIIDQNISVVSYKPEKSRIILGKEPYYVLYIHNSYVNLQIQ